MVLRELRNNLLGSSVSLNTNKHLRSQFRLLDLEEGVVSVDAITFTLLTNIKVRAVNTFVSHTDNRSSFTTVTNETLVNNVRRG